MIFEFYVNRAYTCGLSGFQTFLIAYPSDLPANQAHSLWVRMHGGGVGAFGPDGRYLPRQFFPGSLSEESIVDLAGLLAETGLMAYVREHPARFRFLMPSMCDHDMYSGLGQPELNNPFSPDENGLARAADGLLATKAAIAYTRLHFNTSDVFLHGTSAGSVAAFSVAYSFAKEGILLSGIVMDSAVMNQAMFDVKDQIAKLNPLACVDYLPEEDFLLIRGKIGEMADPESHADNVVARGELSVPIMHVWTPNDHTFCGYAQVQYVDDQGVTRTMGATDYVHEGLRRAIEALPPSAHSENLRLCVTLGPRTCGLHSPTKYSYLEVSPPGDAFQDGLDYNRYIMDWTSRLLGKKTSSPR